MKRSKHYQILTLIILWGGGVACQDDVIERGEDTPPMLQEHKQDLIINDFDGRNECALNKTLSDYLSGGSSLSDKEFTHLYRLKMLNYATTYLSHPGPFNGECSGPVDDYGRFVGTATLTSSSRSITVHHNVLDYSYSVDDLRARAGHLDFAGSTTNIPYGSGRAYPEPKLTDRVWCPEGSNIDGAEEDPFLANRLFSLGFYTWSQKFRNSSVRAMLREAKVRVDDVNATQNFVTMTGAGTYEGKDIAILVHDGFPVSNDVLDRNGKDPNSDYYIDSGPFLLRDRGPFATRVNATTFVEGADQNAETNTDPFHGLNHHFYDRSEETNRAPFISKGYRDDSSNLSISGRVCLAEPLGSQNRSFVDINYTDSILVTNDAIGGTSGSALVGSRTYREDGHPYEMKWYPVIKGLITGTQRDTHADGWHDEETVSLTEAGQKEFKKDVNRAVLLDANHLPWLPREPDYGTPNGASGDPFDPQPLQFPEDGCPGVLEGDVCFARIYLGAQVGQAYPDATGEIGGDTYVNPGGSGGSGGGASGGNGGAGSSTDPWEEFARKVGETDYRAMYCQGSDGRLELDKPGSNRPWRIKFSMMQGVTGSANKAFLAKGDHDARVAAFAPVCVPWSSASWLTNWSWARVQTFGSLGGFESNPVLKGTSDVLVGLRSNLWNYLQNVIELRQVADEPVHARPPSMMNCPPNYYLTGVRYMKQGEGERAPMMGITSIYCHVHEKAKQDHPNLPEEFVRYLNAEDGAYVGLDQYHYLTSEDIHTYPLTQMIGESRADHYESFVPGGSICDEPGTVAIGALIQRDSQGDITFFQLICTGAPGVTP